MLTFNKWGMAQNKEKRNNYNKIYQSIGDLWVLGLCISMRLGVQEELEIVLVCG